MVRALAVTLSLTLAAIAAGEPPPPAASLDEVRARWSRPEPCPKGSHVERGPFPEKSIFCADAEGRFDGPVTITVTLEKERAWMDVAYCADQPCGACRVWRSDGTKVAEWSFGAEGAKRIFVAPGWEPLPPPPPRPPKRTGPPPDDLSINVLSAERVVGDPNIRLPDAIKQTALDRGLRTPRLLLKLCLSKEGLPQRTEVATGSGVEALDDFVRERVLTWRYKPYVVNEQSIPVCVALKFQWTLAK